MIQFDFDWSEPINQLIFVIAVALLFLQLWLCAFSKRSVFTGRLAVRLGLNIFLWLAVMAFILNPFVLKNSTHATGIIIGKNVPSALAAKLTDSLKTAEVIGSADYPNSGASDLQYQESLNSVDTLLLAGQDFKGEIFQGLVQARQHPAVKWIPYFAPDQMQNLKWKAVLRKGEIQNIRGIVKSSKKQVLELRYGKQVLDSTLIRPGINAFKLTFPVFTTGRTSAELVLNNKVSDTIRFYASRPEPLTFHFILANPDFESRSLANWLGKNGHSVLFTTTLSKDIKSQLTINDAKEPDVIITDPGNASNTLVKKGLANGKSILFINLTDPVSEIPQVNAALGTKLQVRKISNETWVKLSPELTALPFHFVPSLYHLSVDKYPVAIEKTSGKIGVSLLNETFPLMLNGDSVTYQKVWSSIFALVRPATKSNVDIKAPIYQDLHTSIELNNFPNSPEFIKIGKDTIFMNNSPVNNSSASGTVILSQKGWINLMDSSGIELFVENNARADAGFRTAKMQDFVSNYMTYHAKLNEAVIKPEIVLGKGIKKKFPDWAWFGIIMFCLAGVWIEGKL